MSGGGERIGANARPVSSQPNRQISDDEAKTGITIQAKSWVAGFFCACLLVAAAIAAFLFMSSGVSAFPKVERKGQYFIYVFTQSHQGAWSFERKLAQVFVND